MDFDQLQTIVTILWAVIGFFSGAMMWSLWLGFLALDKDVRQVGDGNPGASNVIKAGGWPMGLAALLLDILKGAIPVAIAKYALGLDGTPLAIVALAPILGHMYSPFLRFKGGKGVAVSAGVWLALTIWEVPTFGGLTLGLWFAIVELSGWAVLMTGLSLLGYFVIARHDPLLITLLIINLLLVAWKYRADLMHEPGLRPWVVRLLPVSWRAA